MPTLNREAHARQRFPARVAVANARQVPLPTNRDPEWVREPELRMNVVGGIGATTLRRLIATSGFPPPRKLSERILVWSVPDVLAWMASRPDATTPSAETENLRAQCGQGHAESERRAETSGAARKGGPAR
jgi:predicted DNA-binding transcriptional regulator AlpA